jgi:acyl phosphate:glycerol-3-phosphate acyltransferase
VFVRVLMLFAALAIGYLLGAIPVGYLVGKAWGVDVRDHGSGRTGGTNVWRATNQILPPLLTVLGDVLKGMAAVLIGRYLIGSELAAALGGVGAVLGHNWSVMLGWRGGAGGMTAGAALVILSPIAGGIVAVTAIALLYFTHYASIATLVVGVGSLVALTLLALLSGGMHPWVHVVFGALAALSIAYALRPNLKRLVQGNERRITLWK